MPFVPLQSTSRPVDFPRVSPDEQAERDEEARQIVTAEFDQDMPDANRAALEKEYRQRFGNADAPRQGFTSLGGRDGPRKGFVPLADQSPSVLRNVLLENPGAAAGEAALNLGSQLFALPAAGLAGIGTAAGRALGLTDRDPADVVHAVGGAMTYQPRGEFGKAATAIATAPFEALAKVGTAAGDKVLEATDSPTAATAVDTAINALPMAIAPAAKGARSAIDRVTGKPVEPVAASGVAPEPLTVAPMVEPEPLLDPAAGPMSRSVLHHRAAKAGGRLAEEADASIQGDGYGTQSMGGTGDLRRLAEDHQPAGEPARQGLEELRGAGPDDVASVAGELSDLPAGRGTEAGTGPAAVAGTGRPVEGLSAWERGLDEAPVENLASEVLLQDPVRRGVADDRGSRPGDRTAADDLSSTFADAEARPGESGNARLSAVPEELEVPDARWEDAERAGVGEGAGPAAADAAGTTAPGAVTATGIEAGRPARQGFIPLRDSIDAAAHEAATSPLNDKPQPTPAQIEAGVYAKGHVRLHGLDISIENPRGSVRRGVDPTGRPWESELQNHYGYIKGSKARDGDHVDVFLGDHPSEPRAYVVDQIDPRTGRYDEAKAILGAASEADARRIYEANYEPGWKGLGAITPMSMDRFKSWLDSDASKRPVGLPGTRAAMEESKFLGFPVSRLTDRQLDRWGRSQTLPESAKVKVWSEIERRIDRAKSDGDAIPPELNSWAPGANYVPLVDEYKPATGAAASVADLPAPLRRENIIQRFASDIGTTVYEGRIKGEKRLGFFRPHIEEVRTKRANDIEVAAHEVAHLIDFRVPELRAAWAKDKVLRDELKSVSYDQKNVREGFAEGMRLFLTQPETLEAKAPRVSAWLNEFADSHRYGPALRQAQADMTAWFGQDALNRARSKTGTEKPLAEYFDGFWDKFRQATVDDLHGIYRMEKELTGKTNPVGPYESARLSRASMSIADGAVRFGYPLKQADGSFKFAGKGLEEILRPVSKNIDDALLYFVGKSANELMGQGREHLFTKGEIDAMLRLRTPEREKAFRDYQEWNQGVLDFAEAQGIINPEARRLWQRTQYLPFHRVDQPGGIKGKPGDWAGIQALTGGTTNIKDVLGNMIGNASMLIDKAVKNEARRKIANLSQREGGGRFMVKIEPGERMVKVSGDQVLAEMFKRYGIAVDGDAPAFFEFLLKGQPPAGNNVVAVLQGGKPIWFEVGDPILYRALKAIDRPVMNEVVKWLGLPKRIGQATITATPDFWMANIARDTIMGSVMSRAGFRPILDSLKGMSLRLGNDPLYKDFLANGGGLSSIFLDEHHLRTKLERYYRDQGIDYRTVLDTPDKLLTMVETLGDAFEMSTRLGEYRRAVERGENPRHAAYLGRDVSTDFAMKGDSKALGFMYDTVMFLRPALVSWDRLYRGLAHDPNKGAIAAKAGLMALFSTGLYLLNRNDPRYADLPDWDRDSHWHFFIGDQHFRYPKIWEIGALSSAAERTTEKIIEADPQGLGKDFARIIGATFNLNLMPQILAPLYEQARNRNSFTNAPIETPGMENVQPFLRSKPGTSETMKAAGMASRDLPEALQVNPARAEALLRGYFNTYALYGLMLSDQALFRDELPEKRADELPVVRRFYEQEPPHHTKYETEFYDLLQESKRLRGTMRELDAMGYRTYADDKEQSPLAGESKALEKAQKTLGAINKDMDQVRRGNAGPEEKRQKLDALTVERNALLKQAVTESKAAQKARSR